MNSAGRWLRYVYDLSCSGFVELMLTSAAENEEHVGKAIRESGVPREEIFVTTKLGYVFMFKIMLPGAKMADAHSTRWGHHGDVSGGFDVSLKALDIGYVDLFLMHWPQAVGPDGS